MPNILDSNGLQTQSYAELLAYYTQKYQTIYGPSIDLNSNTPDGQMMNIQIQTILDLLDLVTQIYNSFDPDNAIGVILDQRVSINGIQRQGGTYTVTPITVTLSTSVNLYGLDQTANPLYIVADNAGNQWFLITSQIALAPGTHSLSFRSATPGANLPIPNTINVPVTIVLGVTSVNNPTSYTSLGQNEESDSALRIRRQQSVALVSQGYFRALLAALENIPNVSSAFVYENITSTTDSDGIPGHSIWVIVAGSGAPASIALAIYEKRNAGAGMKGSQSYTITQVDGSPFIVNWDNVQSRTVFIALKIISINGTVPPNFASIRPGLVTSLIPAVNTELNINEIATSVQQIDPNSLVTVAGITFGVLQEFILSAVAASGSFVVHYGAFASASISWNDSTPTIQTKIQAVTGLSTATVTGSIASKSLVFHLSSLMDVSSLLYVSSNTLLDGSLVAISFSYNPGYQPLQSPPSKQDQFVLSAPNIILTDIEVTINGATTSTIQIFTTQTAQLGALGGYGTYAYALISDTSGGSVDPVTGVYTAGGSTGTAQVSIKDFLGNTATAIITIV